jgi:hypothetical protein
MGWGECGNEPPVSLKYREFLDELIISLLHRNDCAVWG